MAYSKEDKIALSEGVQAVKKADLFTRYSTKAHPVYNKLKLQRKWQLHIVYIKVSLSYV